MAVRLRAPPEVGIFHSNRGRKYSAYDYQKKLQADGLRPSMNGAGNCYENAAVEACPTFCQIISCCALQDNQRIFDLAAKLADMATNLDCHVSAHQ